MPEQFVKITSNYVNLTSNSGVIYSWLYLALLEIFAVLMDNLGVFNRGLILIPDMSSIFEFKT